MATLQKQNFSTPDETRKPEKAVVEVVKFGEVTAARMTIQPGWKWSTDIKPMVGTESCEAKHIGVIVEGEITCRHDDGTEITYSAGSAYAIEPGHDAWVEGDTPAVAYEFHGVWGEKG